MPWPRQLDAFVNTHIPPEEKFDLVAFSMGGLVSRYYIQKLGGYKRVRRFVTISTPNHGSVLAWLRGEVGVKQMRPGSEMLRDLNGDMSKLVPLDYTSIYTPVDLTIIPAVSSRMPIGSQCARLGAVASPDGDAPRSIEPGRAGAGVIFRWD